MFAADRVFSQRNGVTGLIEWFFNAREAVFGPYNSKDTATKMLQEFVEKCKAAHDDGGRSKKATPALPLETGLLLDNLLLETNLSLETRQYDAASLEYDPLKRKKGKDG